jgi:hypothetical protein
VRRRGRGGIPACVCAVVPGYRAGGCGEYAAKHVAGVAVAGQRGQRPPRLRQVPPGVAGHRSAAGSRIGLTSMTGVLSSASSDPARIRSPWTGANLPPGANLRFRAG